MGIGLCRAEVDDEQLAANAVGADLSETSLSSSKSKKRPVKRSRSRTGKSSKTAKKVKAAEDVIEVPSNSKRNVQKQDSTSAFLSFVSTISKSLSDSGITIDDFQGVVFEGHFELMSTELLGFNSYITSTLEFCFWPEGEFEICAKTIYDDSEEEKFWLKETKKFWVYGRTVPKKFAHRITKLPLFAIKDFFNPQYFVGHRPESSQFDIGVEIYYRRYQLSSQKKKIRNGKIKVSKSGNDKFQFVNKRYGLKFSDQDMVFQQEEYPRILDEVSLQKAIAKGVNMHCFNAQSTLFTANPHLLAEAFE